MISTAISQRQPDIRLQPSWLHYGWVNVVVAAVAMAATFPGRTHGLGMFTEALKRDFDISNTVWAQLNLGATLIGALFCIPIGWLVDRCGTRWILTFNYLTFGWAVLWMSQAADSLQLFFALLLTRGLGQSALSVVSITLVAKWFKGSSLGFAMAIYSVLMGMMFAGLTKLVSIALLDLHWDWREALAAMGWGLLGLAPLSLICTRSSPSKPSSFRRQEDGIDQPDEDNELKHALTAQAPTPIQQAVTARPMQSGSAGPALRSPETEELEGATLSEALRTPAFWVFSLSVSFYGLISSGIFLFNEEIFRDNNIAREAYHGALMLSFIAGIASKFVAAWLSGSWGIHRLLAASMAVLMAALLALPYVREAWQAYLYAIAMAIAGGVVALVFFAIWGQAFGRREVGRIQGIAQMLTVLASALGPLLFGWCRDQYDSYLPAFRSMAPVAFALAIACWLTPLPKKDA